MSARPHVIAPEVIQTSATDCGPACMKSVLAGLGLSISYRALREACQTDVSGSSIDTMEELANQLGVEAEQIMLPLDHVFLPEAHALPAIIVTLTPGGRPHFVVLWKRIGPFVQVMNPATGRHWTTVRALSAQLYQHTTQVPAAVWRDWAGSDEAVAALGERLRSLGCRDAKLRVATALEDPNADSIAALDAATRAACAMVRARAVRPGRAAATLVRSMAEQPATIPEHYWSVRPSPDAAPGEELLLTGAVLLRFRGVRDATAQKERPAIAPDLEQARAAADPDPYRILLGLLAQDSRTTPLWIAAGLVLATTGRIAQALMLRGVLDLGRELATAKQRAAGMSVLAIVAVLLLAIQLPITRGLLGIGRRLEVRLRQAYFEKLPQIEDRYFQSRLASDMASRCHAIHAMRTLPNLAAQFLMTVLELVATAGALVWIAPEVWSITLALAAVTLLLPLVAQHFFFEPDMRVQTHAGSLSGFVLDALVGLTPIRIHGAERSLRRGQEALLVEWTKSRYALQRLSLGFEAVLTTTSYALVVALVFEYLRQRGDVALVLLLVFWALRFPAFGQRFLVLMRGFPSMLNRIRRLLEVIGNVAAKPVPAGVAGGVALPRPGGIAVSFDRVRVKGGGNTILDKLSLNIAPGEHVAIVGPSGAGKSTLVGLLLGWLRPARGAIRVDGEAFDQRAIEKLRRETAWIDPAVQLWNESLLDNLRYGNDATGVWSLDDALKRADLLDILESLPDGLQTVLGEGGSLVSGGQGQRVRLGRAMLRANVRLAILDEPFRGLDRERRAQLLERARELWRGVTLLCVTHDVVQTQGFDRVLVVEGGRIVENGRPAELSRCESSRYAQLLDADHENKQQLWRAGSWQRWWLESGQLRREAAQ
ncbi:MAG TPA: ATP-binding cassette domain-containing protein [Polyangiales bacterium]|nr:ATP-binding cassette domain-containing protein [Polyangiales bacterium]